MTHPPQTKDTLFNTDSITEDFAFTGQVAEVFDDMLDRSVPFYREVIEATARLLEAMIRDGDTVVDLGCSTGTTLLQFCRMIGNDTVHYLGIDTSDPMLEKARLKVQSYSRQQQISFLRQDITDFSMNGVGACVCNYTLQFIRPLLRETFLAAVFAALRPGGVLLLSEKTIVHDTQLNRRYIDIYHGYKRDRGYSELEIARKREALENVLIPFSIDENRALLTKVGFCPVETYFQWFNFVSLVAVKPE